MTKGFELQPDGTYKVEWLTGYKTMPRIKYTIRARKVPFLRFFTKTEYCVDTDIVTIGPFKSVDDAVYHLTLGGVSIRDIEVNV